MSVDASGETGASGRLVPDELKRRVVHVAGAVFVFAYLFDLYLLSAIDLFTWPRLRVVYLAGTALAVVLEFLRLVVGVDWWIYRRLTREYEQSNPAGYALYTVGSTIAVLAFPPAIAIPPVLALALVDPVSGLLSRRDHRRVKRPSVLAVTFVLSGLIALAFVPLHAAVLGATAVTVADGVKPVVAGYVLDDNFTIPVAASIAIWIGTRLPGFV